MYTLECELETTTSLEHTFAVFENPHNLGLLTPSWLGFQILTPSVQMRKGAKIEYLFRWFALPLKWETKITAYRPPLYFVDEAVKGPYAAWRHRHTFQETRTGTVVADHVDYELPLGFLGDAVHRVAVARQLRRIFDFRQTAILDLLGGHVIKHPTIQRQ